MKRIILICSLFVSLSSNAQRFFYHQIKNGASGVVVSDIKNVRKVANTSAYEAFGVVMKNKSNQAVNFFRDGPGHLQVGSQYGVLSFRKYNIVADHWYDKDTLFQSSGPLDVRDPYGGYMDNDSILIYSSTSANGIGSAPDKWACNIFFMRGDSNLNFTDTIPFDWTGKVRLQRGIMFGSLVKGNSAGEYYAPMWQMNVDTGTVPRFRIDVIHSTDYFRTYEQLNAYDGPFGFVEPSLFNFGDNKLYLLLRVQNGGSLYAYNSYNGGTTWTARAASNLGWWIAGGEMVPFAINMSGRGYSGHNNGKLDVMYQDRDNEYITMSRGTDTATFFNTGNPIFNGPELYAYNISQAGAGNSSLGYPSSTVIKVNGTNLGDTIFLSVWSKEELSTKANIWYSRDNFLTDPNGTPVAPPNIDSSSITTTSFKVDILGYTQAQLDNIRYFEFDMSTDPAFGSFVTAKYRSTSVYPTASLLQNIKMFGLWDIYNSLTTGTTYYLRIKACNNVGCSSYTTITVTTL